MNKVLVLGAGGQIARHVIDRFADDSDIEMTLFLRNAGRITSLPTNARIVQGDVLNRPQLDAVMMEQDIVYANLTGEDLDDQARNVIAAMQAAGVQRLVFVLSLGIYDEVPGAFGAWNRRTIGEDLKPFRRAADLIEASRLDYTIVRPAWLTDEDEVDYETTTKGESFRGGPLFRAKVSPISLRRSSSPLKGMSKPTLASTSPTSCKRQ